MSNFKIDNKLNRGFTVYVKTLCQSFGQIKPEKYLNGSRRLQNCFMWNYFLIFSSIQYFHFLHERYPDADEFVLQYKIGYLVKMSEVFVNNPRFGEFFPVFQMTDAEVYIRDWRVLNQFQFNRLLYNI